MIELPALRGDDTLGFLAALGIAGLAEQGAIPSLRLGWTADSSPVALVEGEMDSLAAVSEALRMAFTQLRASTAVIPALGPEFPIRKRGSGSDPMRMPRRAMAAHYMWADNAWLQDANPWPSRWILALCGQFVAKTKGDVALTPFCAPTGQMSLRTSLFEFTMGKVERVDGPGDALVGWRRTSYDGANFDERAKRDAGVTTWGDADNQGAPSPTWLTTMAIRFLPMVENGSDLSAVGWQRMRLYPGYTQRSLIWPTWGVPLQPAAIRVLLAHPALQLRPDGRAGFAPADPGALAALGVTAVFDSSRRTGSQGDGPLGPTVRIWSPDAS